MYYLCVFELKTTGHFPGLAFIWLFWHQSIFFLQFFDAQKLQMIYLVHGIGSSAISVATNVIILTFKMQVNQINIKQLRPKHGALLDTVLIITFFTITIVYPNTLCQAGYCSRIWQIICLKIYQYQRNTSAMGFR